MFHFTLNFAQPILHSVFVIWVCTRDSIFLAFIIQLRFMHLSFAFDIKLFHKQQSSFRIRPSSSVECTFIFSHPAFSICPLSFRFRHPTLGIVIAIFRIRHATFRIELLATGQRPMEIVGSIDLPIPAQIVVERLPSRVDSGDLLHSR